MEICTDSAVPWGSLPTGHPAEVLNNFRLLHHSGFGGMMHHGDFKVIHFLSAKGSSQVTSILWVFHLKLLSSFGASPPNSQFEEGAFVNHMGTCHKHFFFVEEGARILGSQTVQTKGTGNRWILAALSAPLPSPSAASVWEHYINTEFQTRLPWTWNSGLKQDGYQAY